MSAVANAQVVPDGTTSTTVNTNGSNYTINRGNRAGSNLFHSFQDFSVPDGGSAVFNNADVIRNIFSRVTGGNISEINGLLGARGSANLFLINPAGIIFGEGASLNLGGSFLGSTANSILFPDGIEFSATDTQTKPLLTISAPIGLDFINNPGNIINRSIFDKNTNFIDLVGLRVAAEETLALIGGNVSIEGGFLSSRGRIELGSVGANSTASITEIEQGFDLSYKDVANFRDINLNFAAYVYSFGENSGSIQAIGRNISLIEGSRIGNEFGGQAANLEVIASESFELDGTSADIGFADLST
ncbi:MAG: filamentous hemagglutinin N-terminal domain-containing protein [Cyanophyceae cyanobacterium]